MGIQSSSSRYSFNNHYYILEDSFPADNYYRLQSKLTDQLFVGRQIQSLDKQDAQEMDYIITEKLKNPSPFLNKLLSAEKDQEEGYCETNKKFYLLYREIPRQLAHEIQDRRQKRLPFSAEEILILIIRVAKGIKYVYDIGHYHGSVSETTIAWPSNPHQSIQLIDEWSLRDQSRKIKTYAERKQSDSTDRRNIDRANDLYSLGQVAKNLLQISPNLHHQNSPIVQALKQKIFILLSQNPQDRSQIYNFSQQDYAIQNGKVMITMNQSLHQLNNSTTSIHGMQAHTLGNTRMNNNYNNYSIVAYPAQNNVHLVGQNKQDHVSNVNINVMNNQVANIRRSRVTEFKNQMVAAQPTVKFNNNGFSTSEVRQLYVDNRNTQYAQPQTFTQKTSSTVNFGSGQTVKFGGKQLPKFSTPSNNFLSVNNFSTTPAFAHSLNQPNINRISLNQFNPAITSNKSLQDKTPFEQVYIKQKFDKVASNHLSPIPQTSVLPSALSIQDRTQQFTVNNSSQPIVVSSFLNSNYSPTFGSPTFTSPSVQQSSSLFSFQDSLSSNQIQSGDNSTLFTSPDFFSKIQGTSTRVDTNVGKFNNIKIEQNVFQPKKIESAVSSSVIADKKSPQASHSLTRTQNITAFGAPNLVSVQTKQNEPVPNISEFPAVNTSSQFKSYSNVQNLGDRQYVTVIPELNQQSEGEDQDKDREYVVEEYENGSRYEGEKVNGLRDGQGKFYYKEGSYYDGHWKNNNMHGFGRLYYPNHKLAYEGDWFMDQFHGHGKVYNDEPAPIQGTFDYTSFENIEEKWKYYDGTLVCDSKEGFGKLVLSNDEYYEGNFQGDRLHGEGKFVNMYGETIRGVWNDSKLIKINDF